MTQNSSIEVKKLGRELALQLLFQREFADALPNHNWSELFERSLAAEVIATTQTLIQGVTQNLESIDSKIQGAARNWKIERMSLVDRNVLRIGVYEMLLRPDPLPPAIVINECVDLAKRYGTTDSGSFVNGILDQLAKEQGWPKGDK